MPDKPPLNADVLTPRDLTRAKAALGGQNPFELLGDPVTMFPLIIWCLKSRDDPSFTWEQALDTPFGDFDMSGGLEDDSQPPPIASPAGRGVSDAKPEREPTSLSGRRRGSAASTASDPTSTTG